MRPNVFGLIDFVGTLFWFYTILNRDHIDSDWYASMDLMHT